MLQRWSWVACLGLLFIQSTWAKSDKPNIIFLFADDQRADTIGAHGNPHIQTPNLDRMAKEGMSFRYNYCAGSYSGAVCVASRAMLMTGRYWMNLPSTRNSSWKDLPLLPSVLEKQGGYETFIIGKWHNGDETLKKAFSEGRSVYMGGMADHSDFEVQDYHKGILSEKRKAQAFSSTEFTNSAIDYIRSASTEDPFFMYVAFLAPHDPRNPPEPYREMYYKNRPPLPENYKPVHPFTLRPEVSGRDEGLAAWPRTKEVISDQLCEYYGLVTQLDEQVGRILKALENSPHADNTIVVYTADHGLGMGSHGLLGKQNIYEQSMRCPLIITGPGIPKNKSNQSFTYIHDMYATLCNYAGVPVPEGVDSKNLKSIMDGKADKVRDSLFLPFQNSQRGVSDGRYKYHRYPLVDHTMLFDLEKDPHELNDLSKKPEYLSQVTKMEKLMGTWRSELNDPHPLKAKKQLPLEPVYDNSKRTLDVWQPKWIRDKYFDGRNDANHGPKQKK